MELRRYIQFLLLILFVWTTITVVFIIIDSVIVPWQPPQETFWSIVNFLTAPYRFDQGQESFWSVVGDVLQVVFSGSLVLAWLYTWYKLSKKLFWVEMRKRKTEKPQKKEA